jgi:uncharacterized membrane protein YtjA (UPF0391 family)
MTSRKHLASVRLQNFASCKPDWSAQKEKSMLSWALLFFIVAIVAAILGFGGIAGAAAGIAKILFIIFLIFFVISLIMHVSKGRGP